MIFLLLFVLFAMPSFALEPDEILPDAHLEERARLLSREVRCLVCEGETIDESSAPFARDMRRAIRLKLTQGASDDDIRTWLTSLYGGGILLNPDVNAHTLPLWLAPLIFALLAFLFVMQKRKTK